MVLLLEEELASITRFTIVFDFFILLFAFFSILENILFKLLFLELL
jgi:hypothetical protein